MGASLLSGLISGDWAEASELAVCDPDPKRREQLSRDFPGLTVVEAPVAADDAVLAVKPDVAESALRTLAAVGVSRVLSIVARKGIAKEWNFDPCAEASGAGGMSA